jgi:hypothetical protein
MGKNFSDLSSSEQEAMELEYHQMKPEDFDEQMEHAEKHIPNVLRLSPKLAESLQAMAEAAGESEYQPMVRRWIEERLQQEHQAASLR